MKTKPLEWKDDGNGGMRADRYWLEHHKGMFFCHLDEMPQEPRYSEDDAKAWAQDHLEAYVMQHLAGV